MIINTAFAFDNDKDPNYGKYVTTTIAQMLSMSSRNNQHNVYLIAPENFSLDIESFIRKVNNVNNGKIFILKPNYDFSKARNGCTPAVFWRLLLPDLIPQVDKILYFDADMYFNCDVAELYNGNLQGKHIAGVKDLIGLEGKNNQIYHFHKKLVNKIFHDRIIDEGSNYVCAGALVMDLKRIRQDGTSKTFFESLKNNGVSADQDILNVCCQKATLPVTFGGFNTKMYKPFAHEFNLTKRELMEQIRSPKILHCNYPKFGQKTGRSFWFGLFMKPGITGKKEYKLWKQVFDKLF